MTIINVPIINGLPYIPLLQTLADLKASGAMMYGGGNMIGGEVGG